MTLVLSFISINVVLVKARRSARQNRPEERYKPTFKMLEQISVPGAPSAKAEEKKRKKVSKIKRKYVLAKTLLNCNETYDEQ